MIVADSWLLACLEPQALQRCSVNGMMQRHDDGNHS